MQMVGEVSRQHERLTLVTAAMEGRTPQLDKDGRDATPLRQVLQRLEETLGEEHLQSRKYACRSE